MIFIGKKSVATPTMITLNPECTASDVGTWTNTMNTSFLRGMYSSSVVQNNSQTWTVYMPAGKYHFSVISQKNNASGIVSLVINGSTVATVDTYAAVEVGNQCTTSSQFTLSTPATSVTILMATKNGSSSAYDLTYSYIEIVPEGL